MTATTTSVTMTTTLTTAWTTMTDRRVRLGFRGRVIGSFVALVAGALFAGSFVQRAVLLERHDRSVDESLEQERSELERLAAGIDPATGELFADDVEAIFRTFLSRNQPSDGEAFSGFAMAATSFGDGTALGVLGLAWSS